MVKILHITLSITVAIALAACGPLPLDAPPPPPSATPTPLNPNAPLVQDAQMYATAQGVTVEEAVRRLDLQDEIGELGRVLAERERATFAGLWIEHQPKYRVVAAFTRNGEATLRPYLENSPLAELVEVQTARVTLAQLGADQAEAGRIAHELKMRVNTSTDVSNNRVELWVGERAEFEAALRAANLTLPDTVVIVGSEIQWKGGHPDVAATASALGLHFPQLKPGPRVYMEALLLGQLVAAGGCLRVIAPNGERVLVIWQPDVAPDMEAGIIVIRRADGSVAAHVGDNVRFGGGAMRPADADLTAPLPAACPGPYWVSGDLAVDAPPSPTPLPATPTPMPRWAEYQAALAKALLPAPNGLCEWEIWGQRERDGRVEEVYVWAFCQIDGSPKSAAASGPALIRLSPTGAIESVEIPGDGLDFGPDMRRLFPPDVQRRILAHEFDAFAARARVDNRRRNGEPPLIAVSGTPLP